MEREARRLLASGASLCTLNLDAKFFEHLIAQIVLIAGIEEKVTRAVRRALVDPAQVLVQLDVTDDAALELLERHGVGPQDAHPAAFVEEQPSVSQHEPHTGGSSSQLVPGPP